METDLRLHDKETNMKSKLITCVGMLVVLAGCASKTPNLDAKFGDAVNLAKAQQIINPDAPGKTYTEKGIDGQAAKDIIVRYHKAYESPSAAPGGAIGTVGGGTTTLK